VSYGVEKWNREKKPEGAKAEISPELEAKLREHFEPDGRRLAAITGMEPPWLRAGMKPA
jgi:hypothetical protein